MADRVTAGLGQVMLEHCARRIEGDIVTISQAKRNEKTGRIDRTQVKLANPVVVFFPKKQALVMEEHEAQELGFMNRPTIMNLKDVDDGDSTSPGGMVKNAMYPEERVEGFMQLEQELIQLCLSQQNPLPQGATYSDKSVYLKQTGAKNA